MVGRNENTSGELTSSLGANDVSSGLATAVLTVTNKPIVLTKAFTDDPVAPGGTVNLEFSILNLTRGDATNISFSDDLNAVLVGLSPVPEFLPLNGVCGDGSVLDVDGSGVLSLTGGNLEGNSGLVDENGELLSISTCTFSVPLQVPSGAASGQYTNTTSLITADIGGSSESGDPASDILSVQGTVLTKTFTPSAVGPVALRHFSSHCPIRTQNRPLQTSLSPIISTVLSTASP